MTNPNNALIVSDSKKIVKQSNFLINARYETTLLERRIYLKMLSMVEPDDTDFKDMTIDVVDLIEELGLQGLSAYAELKNATKKLMKCICEIKNDKQLTQVALISSAVYQNGKGSIVLHFDPALKPYILDIKSYFTLFDLEEAFGIKSNHSLRMYELLKQYSSTGIRVISLKDLRFSLNISEEQYPNYFDFKKRIILQAQKDLEKTPMAFKFKELKSGKKVINFEFTFTTIPIPIKKEKTTKKELLLEFNASSVVNVSKNDTFKEVDLVSRAKVYEGLINLKMSDYQAKSVMQKASDKEIYQVLYQVTIALLDPKIKNKPAYAYSVFKKKFNLD